MKKIFIIITAVILGIFLGIIILIKTTAIKNDFYIINPLMPKKIVIGFLPYWLLNTAQRNYSKYITTLSYFGLRVDQNGNIQKLLTPQQEEPGWYALHSGKLDQFFNNALKNNVSLSLIIASGDIKAINGLITNPVEHAKNLISDLKPIIDKYKFSDINLDIEYTPSASTEASNNFTKFVKEIKKELKNNESLTVEISPVDVIRNNLINPKEIGQIADTIVLMAYDYHSTSSFVTGPVAPLSGAGITSEYDVASAAKNTLDLISPEKLVLGIPLYGYEWETLTQTPRSAIIPDTGVAASNKRAEKFLSLCATCSAALDKEADEKYITYFDQNSLDYHTLFYPDKDSTTAKINFVKKFKLGGLALWAMGYEGNTILIPLTNYKN